MTRCHKLWQMSNSNVVSITPFSCRPSNALGQRPLEVGWLVEAFYLGCKGAFVVPTPLLRSAKRMPKWRVCMLFTQNHTTHKPDLEQGLKGGSGSGLVSGGSTGGLEILALLDIPAAQRGCVRCLLPDTRIGVGDVWCLASSGAVWRCLEHHSLHPPLCIQLPCHRVRDVGGWADSTPVRLVWAIWATMPRCLDAVWDGLFSVSHEH